MLMQYLSEWVFTEFIIIIIIVMLY